MVVLFYILLDSPPYLAPVYKRSTPNILLTIYVNWLYIPRTSTVSVVGTTTTTPKTTTTTIRTVGSTTKATEMTTITVPSSTTTTNILLGICTPLVKDGSFESVPASALNTYFTDGGT